MYFKYEVIYYCTLREKRVKANGLVFKESYGEVAKELSDFYDEDFIYSIKIEVTDNECPVFEMKEEEEKG